MEEQIKRLIRQGETDTSITQMTGASYATINNLRNQITREEKKKWKHIKPFKESINIGELKTFCTDHLAYLLDIGFRVMVDDNYMTIFNDNKGRAWNERTFIWNDVKDDIIPFLIIIKEKFNYKTVYLDYYMDENGPNFLAGINTSKLDIDNLINDSIEDIKIANNIYLENIYIKLNE